MDLHLDGLPANDLAGHIAAFHDFKSQWLSEGKLPLWIPKRFCGMLQISAVEKFLILPFSFFFSEIASYKLVALLALAIGALGTYRALRLWGVDRTSAYVGGLIFAIHPLVIVDFRYYGHLSFCLTLAVLPFYLSEIHQILTRSASGRSVFFTGFLLAFIFTIHLTMAVIVSLITLATIFLTFPGSSNSRIWFSRASLLGILILIAFAISALSNLPFWIEARGNLALLSPVGSDATPEITYPVRSIVFFFDRMGIFDISLLKLFPISSSYVGWSVFLVTLAGALLQKRRAGELNPFYLGLLWLILAWMALGRTTIVESSNWLVEKGLDKGASLTLWCGLALVLWGFTMAFGGRRDISKSDLLKFVLFGVIVFGAFLLPGYAGLQSLVTFFRKIRAPNQFLIPAFVLLPILVGVAVYHIRQRLHPPWRKVVTAAIVLLFLVDFFPYRDKAIRGVGGFEWPKLVQMTTFLRQHQEGKRVLFSHAYSPTMDYAVLAMAGKNSFSYWLNWAAPRYMGAYRKKTYDAWVQWLKTGDAERWKTLMAIANIHYVVVLCFQVRLPEDSALEKVYHNLLYDVFLFKGTQGVWQIYSANPVYSSNSTTWDNDLVAAFRERRALVADEKDYSPSSPKVEAIHTNLPGKIVQWARPASTRCWAEVEFSQPGILMWSESFHPAWRVRLDGQQADLLRVNHAFMGVRVPPGTHRIEFIFGPYPWRRIGALVSLASLAILVGFSWIVGRRARENKP